MALVWRKFICMNASRLDYYHFFLVSLGVFMIILRCGWKKNTGTMGVLNTTTFSWTKWNLMWSYITPPHCCRICFFWRKKNKLWHCLFLGLSSCNFDTCDITAFPGQNTTIVLLLSITLRPFCHCYFVYFFWTKCDRFDLTSFELLHNFFFFWGDYKAIHVTLELFCHDYFLWNWFL